MPLPKDKFEKGIKPLEKDSLEDMILEFLKKTHAAYTIEEIMDDVIAKRGSVVERTFSNLALPIALDNLLKSNKIVSKEVKEEVTGKTKTYYMAK
jgi:hypothetical protein